jgi:sugar lactone lactonase YvrE
MNTLAKKPARLLVLTGIAAAAAAMPAVANGRAFLGRFHKIDTIASMVPTNGPAKGDQNPYGVAVVSRSIGALVRGDVLVSNFNNGQNQQGTGSSIMEVSPSGKVRVFAVVPRPTAARAVGLTTALVSLSSGYVIVGSLPAPGGSSTAAGAGALTILNSHGHVVRTITGRNINGPWDMTAVDGGNQAVLFVTNVLNGTVAAKGKDVQRGTVVRIKLRILNGHTPVVTSNRVIANGFTEHTDPNALVVGPTGVGLGSHGTLYVADSSNNRIAAIPNALTRTSILARGAKTVTKGGKLNDPLGLAIAPNGDVVTMNGADGNAVETTPSGHLAAAATLVANGAGDLFGLAIAPFGTGIYLVNDAGSGPAANSLQLLH